MVEKKEEIWSNGHSSAALSLREERNFNKIQIIDCCKFKGQNFWMEGLRLDGRMANLQVAPPGPKTNQNPLLTP